MLTQARRATAVVGATLTAPVNAVLCLALAILVAAVASTPRLWIDKVAREHLSGHPSLVEAAVTIERVGQRGVMTAALLLTALLVARRLRAWGPVWLALLTPVAVTAVVGAAKLVVGRPFPREPMEQAVPLSGHLALPSGHAAGAVVFWGRRDGRAGRCLAVLEPGPAAGAGRHGGRGDRVIPAARHALGVRPHRRGAAGRRAGLGAAAAGAGRGVAAVPGGPTRHRRAGAARDEPAGRSRGRRAAGRGCEPTPGCRPPDASSRRGRAGPRRHPAAPATTSAAPARPPP
jgi:hypothetical protein